jgi:molecular chaperone HtpG
MREDMTQQTFHFQAEVARLLNIVTHALYTNKEIFLRELISNASDACDRLRYAGLTKPELLESDGSFRITITPNSKNHTVTISDNGMGMSKDEMIENLGTIARSGTMKFVEELSGDERKDVHMIGQFGVGFYSAFMVATKVEVISRKAGEQEAHEWISEGSGSFEIKSATKASKGTDIVLHLKKEAVEYLEAIRLKHIIKTHSDYVAVPIFLKTEEKEEQINAASALWTRSRNEITPEQYKEFYHHVGLAYDDPWMTLHYKAEGAIEYTSLLFVPSAKPFDLFDPERKSHLKLFIKRVFITDDCQGLLPSYLRFVRGVIDAEDLPLNISRETLQHDPRLLKMQKGITKKVLEALKEKAKEDPESYLSFWKNFGAVLKEGLYEESSQQETLFPLCRFRSSESPGWITLDSYIEALKEGQTEIFYIAGADADVLKQSPQLEGFKARGINVLILTDPVDEFWISSIQAYQGKPFKSITRGDINFNSMAGDKEENPSDKPLTKLEEFLKQTYGEKVKEVRTSHRLTNSPACLVAAEGDVDFYLEKLLQQTKNQEAAAKRILELNPTHPLILAMEALVYESEKHTKLTDLAFLLLDEVLVLEGQAVRDPKEFIDRLNRLMLESTTA